MYNIFMENEKDLVIITGAAGRMGQLLIDAFSEHYDLLLVDVNQRSLEKINETYQKRFLTQKVDITSTVDLAKLSSLVKKQGGFKFLIHLARLGPDVEDIANIYKVNLIGTRSLFNYLYPLIRPKGVIINIGASALYQTPIPQTVFSLLSDPFNPKFLETIVPLTPTSKEAYWWSKYTCACLSKNDALKWQLKTARMVTVFPDAIDKNTLKNDPCSLKIDPSSSSYKPEDDDIKLIELLRYIICEDNVQMSGVNIAITENGQITYFNDFK